MVRGQGHETSHPNSPNSDTNCQARVGQNVKKTPGRVNYIPVIQAKYPWNILRHAYFNSMLYNCRSGIWLCTVLSVVHRRVDIIRSSVAGWTYSYRTNINELLGF